MRPWTLESIAELARAFQPAAVLAAAAELDVFTPLSLRPLTARQAARLMGADLRGAAILLDALASLGLLTKSRGRYRCAPGVAPVLSGRAPRTLLPGLRHLANCLRRWADLARTVKTGRPGPDRPSILGAKGDAVSFIGAMHSFSSPAADKVAALARPGSFTTLLDVGGGSGTWTMAFLRRKPGARAILFDLPSVTAMAKKRLGREGFLSRVRLASGDYLKRRLPRGADLAWLSAIVHQHSRPENRRLYQELFRALEPGGRLLIRDVVMDESHTMPSYGALFAVNMLAGTRAGGTFSLSEFRQDLAAAGFKRVRLIHRDPGMHSLVEARKPR
ncbi:MAG: methyltransferase domain-containing protein [Elusimicrobia bacterium]|nr:methyltransferase domain-containing protein [Elusimicrobiota bacterium]